MSKEKISKTFKNFNKEVSKHSPEILTGIGIAGMITTTVLAVKATPKAVILLNEAKEELETEKLPVGETVKTVWKLYIPAVALGVTSTACLIGANSVNAKRNAALATAYQLSRNALIEYKDKVVEVVGEKKAQTIREKIDEDHVKKKPVTSQNQVYITGKGNTLFYDYASGRYFMSDKDKIDRAINELNRRMVVGMEEYVSLNELYDAIDLEQTAIGDDLGWNVGQSLIEPEYSAQMAHGVYEGEPCICLSYLVEPRYNYHKLM